MHYAHLIAGLIICIAVSTENAFAQNLERFLDKALRTFEQLEKQSQGANRPLDLPSKTHDEQDGVRMVAGLSVGQHLSEQALKDRFPFIECRSSTQFDNFSWCTGRSAHDIGRRSFVTTTVALGRDDAIGYVNQSYHPAIFSKTEIDDDIKRLSAKQKPPTNILTRQLDDGNAKIAVWGSVKLTPLGENALASIKKGKPINEGILVDFINDYPKSAQSGLPVYRVTSGTGYIWIGHRQHDGKGNLRFFAIDAGKLYRKIGASLPAGSHSGSSLKTEPTSFLEIPASCSKALGGVVDHSIKKTYCAKVFSCLSDTRRDLNIILQYFGRNSSLLESVIQASKRPDLDKIAAVLSNPKALLADRQQLDLGCTSEFYAMKLLYTKNGVRIYSGDSGGDFERLLLGGRKVISDLKNKYFADVDEYKRLHGRNDMIPESSKEAMSRYTAAHSAGDAVALFEAAREFGGLLEQLRSRAALQASQERTITDLAQRIKRVLTDATQDYLKSFRLEGAIGSLQSADKSVSDLLKTPTESRGDASEAIDALTKAVSEAETAIIAAQESFKKDGAPDGPNTWVWANGDRFVGEFKEGKRHGRGTFSRSNGDKYEGQYIEGKRNGPGAWVWANGNKFTGQYREDKPHGPGTFVWADGSKLVGVWNDGVIENGTKTWQDGRSYTGQFDSDTLNPKARFSYSATSASSFTLDPLNCGTRTVKETYFKILERELGPFLAVQPLVVWLKTFPSLQVELMQYRSRNEKKPEEHYLFPMMSLEGTRMESRNESIKKIECAADLVANFGSLGQHRTVVDYTVQLTDDGNVYVSIRSQ